MERSVPVRGERTARRTGWRLRPRPDGECRREGPGAGEDGGDGHGSTRPPGAFTLLPWLLLGMGAISNVIQGETPNPWVGGLGLLVFNSLYVGLVFRAFDKRAREAAATRWCLVALGVVTCALALAYGGNWLLFFPLLGLATGAVLRGRRLGQAMFGITALTGLIAGRYEGWDTLGIVYGTFVSGMVTAAILALSETVRELRDTRQELARSAVERERLRFSRDLHDLLGHTLSVIVVKSEAARRIAPRDIEAALDQVRDIESVGRQALTEIREAVTGYRRASLGQELDRARGALAAAGIEPFVRQSGPPLPPQTAALLGWVVRESVTNVLRHGGSAATCEIEVRGSAERVRLTVTDDGGGTGGGAAPADPAARVGSVPAQATVTAPPGSGLTGLAERLAAAGGTLLSGPLPGRGFRVRAELPVEPAEGEAPDVTAVRADEETG
ncbi:sensor histidine kinase [Streptomyces subrutilus]|uniref:Sensor histidine kinase n=1 Tax=Streptomyces subrutilus TaxID=36818 RepID=A0A5P2UH67_9ACTN|nr:histidine kinase [Streptomyces subrutilus]QEU77769.1 sensor histidine kinase [Streptomyces subrutilus]WSJ33122.1 histidine kinase [Streptomyces subrutilus]GGZ62020.1 two-component sensor histidine kinase [Streptomyces subrutilus]